MPTIPEKDLHQKMLITLIRALSSLIDTGELRASPSVVYLDGDTSVRPDMFWVRGEDSRCKLDEDGFWRGAPDLVVEILSPASEAQDRGLKFDLYERCGVHEYWLINPEAQFVEVYVLINKKLMRHGLHQPGGAFHSGVLDGREIDVRALFGLAPARRAALERQIPPDKPAPTPTQREQLGSSPA